MKVSTKKILGYSLGIQFQKKLCDLGSTESLESKEITYKRYFVITLHLIKWRIDFSRQTEDFKIKQEDDTSDYSILASSGN